MSEEGFGHEADLVVHCKLLVLSNRISWRLSGEPSVFHATAGAIHAAANSKLLVSILFISSVCAQSQCAVPM